MTGDAVRREPVTVTLSHEGVAVLRLNRPERRNALDLAMKTAMLDALRHLAATPSVRAVVLVGSGSTFSVGQDLDELQQTLDESPETAAETVERHYNPITLLLATMPKPVVAAVNGTCVGAALGFALACDVQVWSAGATLSTAFTRVGLTCDSGLSATLAEAVGTARALELVLLAEPFTVTDAMGWGFAGHVVDPDDVEDRAMTLATRLAAGPTQALAASKRLIRNAHHRSLTESLQAEHAEQAGLARTSDHPAGVRAFLTRTEPVFTGT